MYCVSNRYMLFAATLLLMFLIIPYSFAGKYCECPSPPGGGIQCEDNQFGFCKLRDGKINGACITPPQNLSKGFELEAWILSELLNKKITANMVMENAEFKEIINKGTYVNPSTGEATYFILPK